VQSPVRDRLDTGLAVGTGRATRSPIDVTFLERRVTAGVPASGPELCKLVDAVRPDVG
jgi:hypothetical protein